MIGLFLQGFFLQSSLILALGAQNLFVLSSGLKKQRPILVASICSLCDSLLVFLGVLGVATLFIQVPILKITLGFVGVAFLFFYGVLKLRESSRGPSFSIAPIQQLTLKKTVLTSFGFSLLNPHVYLDTVVLIGGYATKFSGMTERFYFGSGACVFSTLWFFGLVGLASLFGSLLNTPKAIRIISLVSGVILITLSLKLGSDVITWIKQSHI